MVKISLESIENKQIAYNWPQVELSRAGLSRFLIEKCVFHQKNVFSTFQTSTATTFRNRSNKRLKIQTKCEKYQTAENSKDSKLNNHDEGEKENENNDEIEENRIYGTEKIDLKMNNEHNYEIEKEKEIKENRENKEFENEQNKQDRNHSISEKKSMKFTYRQVLEDCLKIVTILRNNNNNKNVQASNGNCVNSNGNLDCNRFAITGDNGYEHLCALLATLLFDSTTIPLQGETFIQRSGDACSDSIINNNNKNNSKINKNNKNLSKKTSKNSNKTPIKSHEDIVDNGQHSNNEHPRIDNDRDSVLDAHVKHECSDKTIKVPNFEQVLNECRITQLLLGRRKDEYSEYCHSTRGTFSRKDPEFQCLSVGLQNPFFINFCHNGHEFGIDSRLKEASKKDAKVHEIPVSIEPSLTTSSPASPSTNNIKNGCQQDLCQTLPVDASSLGLNTIEINHSVTESMIQNNNEHLQNVRFIIPKFRRTKLCYSLEISETVILTQLCHATLPQCGFGWTENDIIQSNHSLNSWMGILELLVCLSVGAQYIHIPQMKNEKNNPVLNDGFDLNESIESLIERLENSQATAIIIHSFQLLDLLKYCHKLENIKLQKVIYYGQPMHKTIVDEFCERFQLKSCKYALYHENSGGFIAMEMFEKSDADMVTMLAPLPGTNFVVLNSRGRALSSTNLGKIFVRPSPGINIRRIGKFKKSKHSSNGIVNLKDQNFSRLHRWQFTQYVGFHQNGRFIALIDHYCNFVKIRHRILSLGLVETILLAQDNILRVNVKQTANDSLTVYLLIDSSAAMNTNFHPRHCLDAYLKDFIIDWKIVYVSKFRRRGVNHLYSMKRLCKRR